MIKLEPGKFYILNVRHNDDCRFWQSDDIADCNCEPDLEQVEVNDANIEQVAEEWDRNEESAERLRQLAKRRN